MSETTSRGSPHTQLLPLHASPSSPHTDYTLPRRPWRRYTTPFSSLLAHPYPGSGIPEDPHLVDWLPKGDPENPLTWSEGYKWAIMAIATFATLGVALASSALSAAEHSVQDSFPGYSREIYTLVLSMFVLGFALGPLLWAPAGEVSGRRTLYILTFALFTLFNGVCCASQNLTTLIVMRLLSGISGAAPLSNSGGTVADLFTADERGIGMVVFSAAPFMGPALGPICGGFLGETAGWRWVAALLAILSAVLTLIGTLFLPETYPVVLLRQRAALLSRVTGRTYVYKGDKGKDVGIVKLYETALSRPWALLFKEPIVFLLAIYMAIIIGTLYLLFGAFPIVFQEERGWSPGIGGLSFIGVLVGCMLAVVYSVAWENPRYARKLKEAGGWLRPEERLPSAILGGILLPVGLFSFAWTAAPRGIPWIAPIICSAPFGMGMVLLFLSVFNYLVDAYLIYSASVLAGNVVVRCLSGMAFPLFTTQMYNNLGINWASTLVAFLSLSCTPLPILFYIYGERIRVRTKFGREANEIGQAMRRTATMRSVQEKTRSYEDQTARAQPGGPAGV
ncbi:mitochondrial import receptor subunit tom20 [Naganishia albida]|nr:mitochondrial import receptor subunit tom20 [Naganishia albida]